jgi:hypothetical protein
VSNYKVHVMRSHVLLRQRYWVQIRAANGEPLLASEMFTNKGYAKKLAEQFAHLLDGNLIDDT